MGSNASSKILSGSHTWILVGSIGGCCACPHCVVKKHHEHWSQHQQQLAAQPACHATQTHSSINQNNQPTNQPTQHPTQSTTHINLSKRANHSIISHASSACHPPPPPYPTCNQQSVILRCQVQQVKQMVAAATNPKPRPVPPVMPFQSHTSIHVHPSLQRVCIQLQPTRLPLGPRLWVPNE
jgi:hypothetical protein